MEERKFHALACFVVTVVFIAVLVGIVMNTKSRCAERPVWNSECAYSDALLDYTVDDHGYMLAVNCLPVEGGKNIVAIDVHGNEVARVFTNDLCYNSMCYYRGEWVPAKIIGHKEGYISWRNAEGGILRIVWANRMHTF